MNPTLWASILNSKKAIVAGLSWLLAFVTAVLVANGGKSPTLLEWIIALGGYVASHTVTYAVSNEPRTDLSSLANVVDADTDPSTPEDSYGEHAAAAGD